MASHFVYENNTIYPIPWMEMNVELRNIIFFITILKSPLCGWGNSLFHFIIPMS